MNILLEMAQVMLIMLIRMVSLKKTVVIKLVASLKLDFINVDIDNYKEGVNKIINIIKDKWPLDRLKYKEYNGGLTNKLIGISLINNEDDSSDISDNDVVLCRIFGNGTDKFIDRSLELNNMKLLYDLKIGSKLYCQFNNGICYEYINGIIINHDLLQDESVFSKVAKLVAKYHLIQPQSKSNGNDEINKKEPLLFNKINELLHLVPDKYENNLNGKRKDLIKLIPNKEELIKQVNYIKEYLINYLNKSSMLNNIVFSHNDLLLANIIYDKTVEDTSKQISFIDYEYSGYNYQAYDIANHFNEYAGTDNVNFDLYPSKEYQFKWLDYYLSSYLKDNGHSSSKSVDESLINDLYKQVNKFALASHLFWGIWSIVQASCSNMMILILSIMLIYVLMNIASVKMNLLIYN